ncbi:MAG: hypothetical protein M3R15_15965 [Acidobacteriota bacterium]|nr:hypothetical protein [Acidobacteriota bacterium]
MFRITEVPITLHPDGRKEHAPQLKTFRDGWHTLRFMLMYACAGSFSMREFFWFYWAFSATLWRCRA